MLSVPAWLSCDVNCIINGTICVHYVKTTETRCHFTLLVVWCCWHCNFWDEAQLDFLVICCQWWHHIILMASSIAPLHLFLQYDQNKLQHDFFSHLTLLALASASFDVNSILNRTTAFIRSRWLKQCVTIFWACDATGAGVSVTLCKQGN